MEGEMITVEPENAATLMRRATDAAGVSKEIVVKTAVQISGRKYVKVEGWQAIAVAHGCTLTIRSVTAIDGGIASICDVVRISDGQVIASAEGFVGEDETTWSKRPMYARRAMAQTRAMSRAARSAFAHVVVLIDSNLSTTPAEEVPDGGFEENREPRKSAPKKSPLEHLRSIIPEANTIESLLDISDRWEAKKDTMNLVEYNTGRREIDEALTKKTGEVQE